MPAATMNEIEATTADPYMGFNLGSAMIRQDSEGVAHPFIFESPLLRLIKDHGYIDAFQNGGIDYADKLAPVRSIWIYRYYKAVVGTRRVRCTHWLQLRMAHSLPRICTTNGPLYACSNRPMLGHHFDVIQAGSKRSVK